MHTMPIDKNKIEQSLSISWKEGIPASIMMGIMDYYLIPFALFLGASTQQIGMLVAIPTLIAAIALPFVISSIKIVGSRLKYILIGTFVQAIFLLPIAFLSYFQFEKRIMVLILLVVIFRVLTNLNAAVWGSLVSEYLPPTKRGEYFGWRSQIIGIAGLIAIISAGLILSHFKKFSLTQGFFLIFLTIAICRFISFYLTAQMTDIPHEPKKEDEFTFLMFIRRFKESNFVKFILFVASITFATHLAAPYFSVYLLRELHFSYINYMLITLVSVLGGLIAFPIWGKHADVVGNAKVLKLTGFLVPLIPVLWMVSGHPTYLIAVEFCSGFIWGGFNLCATNFVYDAAVPSKRIRCLAYFNLINGFALFLGATLGGYLADLLPPTFGFKILTLFLISAILRYLAHFLLSGNFKEVREVSKIPSYKLFFSVIGIRPILGGNPVYDIFPLFKLPFSKTHEKKE